MFKIPFSILLIFFSLNGFAQKTDIDIPMKNGKVYYEKSYKLNKNLQQEELLTVH